MLYCDATIAGLESSALTVAVTEQGLKLKTLYRRFCGMTEVMPLLRDLALVTST
jgi:hypothetical protein